MGDALRKVRDGVWEEVFDWRVLSVLEFCKTIRDHANSFSQQNGCLTADERPYWSHGGDIVRIGIA
jgi:hypothetical protein